MYPLSNDYDYPLNWVSDCRTTESEQFLRYQRGNQNPHIEKEQTTQWPKEKVQNDGESNLHFDQITMMSGLF
jgi:hypothetical protein